MDLIDFYHEKCQILGYTPDSEQERAIIQLDRIYKFFNKKNYFLRLLDACFNFKKNIKGLYFYGNVGSGKTFIMDCFYESITYKNKLRIHFHEFIDLIHLKLKKYSSKKNPLRLVAKEISKKFHLICFDEFYINDVVDAMLLGGLLKELYRYNIVLIFTSNIAPDDLYKNGLQRDLFKKTISLIKMKNICFRLDHGKDYRLNFLESDELFFKVDDPLTNQCMDHIFNRVSGGNILKDNKILMYDRYIQIVKHSNVAVWFDFAELCKPPRNQQDYLLLAERYKIIFIQNIYSISSVDNNTIALFIKLIDVLYDKKIILVCSLYCPIDDLYRSGSYHTDFLRTRSRLAEMKSIEYVNKYYSSCFN